MRTRTRHRRLVRWFGGLVAAATLTSGLAIGLGGGVAGAEGSSTWQLAPNTAPSLIQQNTRANSSVPRTGAGAGWTFTIQGDWDTGDTFTVTVFPNNYDGTTGVQCQVPYSPLGFNQNQPDAGNYIGFAAPEENDVLVEEPVIESEFPAGAAPTFDITFTNPISCSSDAGHTVFQTMVLTATNSGNGQASQLATVRVGWSTNPPPPGTGPVMFDVGYSATTGPAHFVGGGSGTAAFAVESSVTVVGMRPSANDPRSTLVRNSASDAVSGAISQFKIFENVPNAVPPPDGQNNHGGTQDLGRHILNSHPAGAVCLGIDNSPGNALVFPSAPGWMVDPGASASPNSAAAGPGVVTLEAGGTIARLPVQDSSNTAPTVWTTTGLKLAGTARTDGSVWAYVWWANGDTPCTQVPSEVEIDQEGIPYHGVYTLGYVQLVTISEVAPPIFGQDAEATAAQAINHQFDYAKGDCVSNTVGNNFEFGPSIFLARSDLYIDGLGAAYAAGSVDSGVLLTPPNSLHPLTEQTIRLQGVQTVFVAGGPLAISDAVVNQLQNTISYHCGGTSPRLDPDTGLPKHLVVIRIFGPTWMDTNERLAEFVGAEPPAAFGAFLGGTNTNPFNTGGGMATAGTPPAGAVNTALLVTGENFQDAMVASVPAYGGDFVIGVGQTGPMPLIATPSNSLSQQAINAMFEQHIGQVIVVGGPLAVSDNVINQALAAIPGLYVIRIGGVTASDTSVQLAMFELSKTLGFGYLNADFDWGSYVNRTAGNINFNPFNDDNLTAHVVLMTRGDHFADAMAAAAVLSVHNGRFINEQKFPLIITNSPTDLGPYVTNFLRNGSLYISALTGASPSLGLDGPFGDQNNNVSSNVFTIQPIGGPIALSPAILTQAGTIIGS